MEYGAFYLVLTEAFCSPTQTFPSGLGKRLYWYIVLFVKIYTKVFQQFQVR